MNTLREEFEALMPKSVAVVLSWTNSSYSRNYRIVWSENVEEGTQLHTADQVREAMKAVAERCAVICDGLGEAAKSCADMDRTGNVSSMAESADACAAAIRAQAGGDHE